MTIQTTSSLETNVPTYSLTGVSSVPVDSATASLNGGVPVVLTISRDRLSYASAPFTLDEGRNEFEVVVTAPTVTGWSAVTYTAPPVASETERLLHLFPVGMR